MRRNLHLFIWAALVLLVGCIGGIMSYERLSSKVQVREPEIVLVYGEVNSEGHLMNEMAEYFSNQVTKLSEGRIKIEVYPSGQLGDDRRCYQALKMGALDLYRGNVNSLNSKDLSPISVLSLPYIFEDGEHFWKVCDSDLGKELLEDVEKTSPGLKGLAFLDEGARNFFTVDKPIRRLEDLDGLDMRVQVSDLMYDTLSALGADIVPIEYVELYSALEGGTVEGAENPAISYYYNRFYEKAPYFVKDMHTYSPGVILISEITWNNLGEEFQQIISRAARMTQAHNRMKIRDAETKVYEALEEEGVVITEVEDIQRWKNAVKPVYEKYGRGQAELITRIRAMRIGKENR